MMTRFQVTNYKCLADVALDLTPLHVVIGQNDSGKTSLLEAILALHKSTEGQLSESFPGRWDGRDLVYDGATEPRVDFRASFLDGSTDSREESYHLAVHFPENGRACELVAESYGHGDQQDNIAVNPNYTALALRNLAGNLPEAKQREYSRIAGIIGRADLYRLDPKTMAVPASIDPKRKFRLDRDGFGLASLLDDLLGYEPELFLAIRREFCEYFPQFQSLRIETEPSLVRQFSESGIHSSSQGIGKGIFFETIHGRSIRAEQASDGAILFLGLLALMYTPKPPKMLLVEEPEKGVYPKRLVEVIAILRRLEAQSALRPVPQIVLTTHSPYLLSAFQPEEVTLLSREGETGPVRARGLRDAPHIHERLNDGEFYLGELWYNLSEDELFADA